MLSKNENQTREIANYLLNHCFIVGNNGSNDRDKYYYVVNNKDEFEKIFKPLGYEIKDNPMYKVIHLKSLYNGKIHLRKSETILLLLCRLIYLNKMESLSFNKYEVVTTINEIKEEYEKLGLKKKFDKGFFESASSRVKNFNLIKINGKINDMDTQIKIFPSIRMVMSDLDIEQTTNLLKQYDNTNEVEVESDD